MKPSELEAGELDAAVARALGHRTVGVVAGVARSFDPVADKWGARRFSSDWAEGGPIIESERIAIRPAPRGQPGWIAAMPGAGAEPRDFFGPTPLAAAMRAFVASRLGTEPEAAD